MHHMKKSYFFIASFLLLACCLGGCGKKPPKRFQIGVDPSFFPLELDLQAARVYAFTSELLREISQAKNIELVRINQSWDNLIDGLERGRYQGAFSIASPNLINNTRFSFSDPYLNVGPVLVVPKEFAPTSLDRFSGQVVAMEKSDPLLELMTHYPNVEFLFYDSVPQTLENIAHGRIHGGLIPILLASAYVRDLFHDSLTISSGVLTNQAIRLITKKGENKELIALFNEGLREVHKNGVYQKLLDKWNLSQ